MAMKMWISTATAKLISATLRERAAFIEEAGKVVGAIPEKSKQRRDELLALAGLLSDAAFQAHGEEKIGVTLAPEHE